VRSYSTIMSGEHNQKIQLARVWSYGLKIILGIEYHYLNRYKRTILQNSKRTGPPLAIVIILKYDVEFPTKRPRISLNRNYPELFSLILDPVY
jgi:hypothetical protein